MLSAKIGVCVRRASDNRPRPERRLARRRERIPGPELEHRDVQADEPATAQIRKPPEPFERQFDLSRAPREGNPSGRLCRLPDDPVRLQSVPRLKAPDTVHDRADVAGTRLHLAWRQVADVHQQLVELSKAGIRVARPDGRARSRESRRTRSVDEAAIPSKRRAQGSVLSEWWGQVLNEFSNSVVHHGVPQQRGKVVRFVNGRQTKADRARIDSAEVQVAHVPQHARAELNLERGRIVRRRRCHIEARQRGREWPDVVVVRVESVSFRMAKGCQRLKRLRTRAPVLGKPEKRCRLVQPVQLRSFSVGPSVPAGARQVGARRTPERRWPDETSRVGALLSVRCGRRFADAQKGAGREAERQTSRQDRPPRRVAPQMTAPDRSRHPDTGAPVSTSRPRACHRGPVVSPRRADCRRA